LKYSCSYLAQNGKIYNEYNSNGQRNFHSDCGSNLRENSLPNRKVAMRNSYILIIISAVLWGSVGLTIRILASFGFSTIQIIVFRFITAALCFGLYILITDRRKFRIDKTDIKYFMAFSLFVLLAYNICFVTAIRLTSYAVATGLLYTSPIWAMFLSIYVFKEKLTKRKGIAILLSFTGCGLITGLFSSGGVSLTPIAFFAGLGAGMGYGAQGVFTKKLMEKYHSFTVVFYFFLFAVIFGLPFCNFGGMLSVIASAPMSLLYGMGGAIICYIVPFAFYTYALNFIEASRAAVIVSVEPIVAALLGFFVYDEPITVFIICGIAFIISAVVVLYEPTPKKITRL